MIFGQQCNQMYKLKGYFKYGVFEILDEKLGIKTILDFREFIDDNL